METRKRELGPEHPDTLSSMANLTSIYSNQGHWKEAEKIYERALEGYEKAWGPEHPSTLDTVDNLGNLYADQGKLAEAENIYLRALTGYKKLRGLSYPTTKLIGRNSSIIYSSYIQWSSSASIRHQLISTIIFLIPFSPPLLQLRLQVLYIEVNRRL